MAQGTSPSVDIEALYPGLIQGVTPLQEREGGGGASIAAGGQPAFTVAGFIIALIILRLIWEAAR